MSQSIIEKDSGMEYKNKRIGGLVTVVVGAVLGKIFIVDVLESGRQGQAQITVHRTGIVASILCVLLGLLYVLFGDKVENMLKFDAHNLSFKNVVVLLALAGVGLAAYVWVNMQLSGLGYK
ncbi:MAG: hypothetical protein A2Z46_02670 [Nitrospirae bacterium RBG_19FT_COMBO_55_12]|nr:MAG: hypothetical protein A2Z46_02670 [Nitrospirae bacterium RBG_19FT_COMBO_55_12]